MLSFMLRSSVYDLAISLVLATFKQYIRIGMPKKCVFVHQTVSHDQHKTNAWYDSVSYVSL